MRARWVSRGRGRRARRPGADDRGAADPVGEGEGGEVIDDWDLEEPG
jgi:hypothetical protein